MPKASGAEGRKVRLLRQAAGEVELEHVPLRLSNLAAPARAEAEQLLAQVLPYLLYEGPDGRD